jgi:3-oxoadipate enol-lactonase
MSETHDIQTVTIEGDRVAYRRFGTAGSPPILLLHGLYGDSSTVATVGQRLGESFDVVAPDALGHGRSAHPASFTLEGQGRMLLGLATELGFERFSLVGISMGSYLAAQTAILDPDRIEHLVLVVSKAHGLTSSSSAYAARNGFDLASATPEETFAFLSGAVWSPETTDADRARIGAELAGGVQLTGAERDAVEASLAGFDLRPSLGLITAKTLVVSGRSDGLNPPESGREVADGIPGAVFEIYERSGHALPYEEEDRFVSEVTAFIGA